MGTRPPAPPDWVEECATPSTPSPPPARCHLLRRPRGPRPLDVALSSVSRVARLPGRSLASGLISLRLLQAHKIGFELSQFSLQRAYLLVVKSIPCFEPLLHLEQTKSDTRCRSSVISALIWLHVSSHRQVISGKSAYPRQVTSANLAVLSLRLLHRRYTDNYANTLRKSEVRGVSPHRVVGITLRLSSGRRMHRS